VPEYKVIMGRVSFARRLRSSAISGFYKKT
jgi:hypothetical protein